MKVNYAIIPECYTDTNLIETITNSFNKFNHQMGCNNVSKTMQSPKLIDSFAVGIIDKDKRAIKYLDTFEKITESVNIFLFKHPDKHHYIVQISPAIEKFILNVAKEVGVKPETFGLPDEFEHLKKITKRKTSRHDLSLRQLFLELKNNKAQQIVTLAKWISYLKEKNYEANMEELRTI